MGGAFDANDVYYIDSQYAGGSASDTITILAAPSESSFVITADDALKWDKIDYAKGYEYYIAFDGADYGDLKKVDFNSFNINNYKQYNSISVKIRARGDGNKVIASAWAEWNWTK